MSPVSPNWFGVAVHALALLANSDEVCPSATIACGVNTHAVFLRRVLAQLVRARIVEAREGRDGGYRLARPAAEIRLADVYRALRAPAPIPLTPRECETLCDFNRGMQGALAEMGQEAEEAMVATLERRTVADLLHRAEHLAGAS